MRQKVNRLWSSPELGRGQKTKARTRIVKVLQKRTTEWEVSDQAIFQT